jgi:immunity protein 26 of polymorphic toxin system
MSKKANKPGTFMRIPLADGSFGYGRILEPPHSAFYNYRTTNPDSDLDRIASKPVLFRIPVRYSGPRSWENIGWREIEAGLAQPIVQFTQDILNLQDCRIFDTAGNVRSATPEECVGLEAAAVWERHHVEERLLDFFMGRPNAAVEHLKVRLT